METKRCCKCKQEKPVSKFYRDRSRPDGLEARCKDCFKEYWQRPEVKEKTRLRKRQWARDNPRYDENYQIQWRKNNQDILARWRKNNKSRLATYQRRRQARREETLCQLTQEAWEWLLKLTDHRCVYCGKHESKVGTLHQEHVIPISRGGAYAISNIRPACKSCNSRKKDRTPEEAGMTFAIEINTLELLEQQPLL